MSLLAAQLAGEFGAAGTEALRGQGLSTGEGPQQDAETLFNLRRLLLLKALGTFQAPFPFPTPGGPGGGGIPSGVGFAQGVDPLVSNRFGLPGVGPTKGQVGGGGPDLAPDGTDPSGASVGADTPPDAVAGPLGGGLLAALLGPLTGAQGPDSPNALMDLLMRRMFQGDIGRGQGLGGDPRGRLGQFDTGRTDSGPDFSPI